MPINGEIMEISGLGQPDATYTSFLYAKLTKNGQPVKGTLDFYDEDMKKLQSKQTDANGTVLVTFSLPKITRIYVAAPGMSDIKTVPGMTTDNAAEAKTPINTVTYEIPAGAGGAGGPGIAAFWGNLSTTEKVLLVGSAVALIGVIAIIVMNKKESPLMEGIDTALGWVGIGNEDCE